MYSKIFVASDHAGLEMKRHLIDRYPDLPWVDLGPLNADSVDYPDYAEKLCKSLEPDLKTAVGVLVCGSGQGMAIRANRFKFIRAALCWTEEIVTMARQHNDANVLCLPGRYIPFPLAEKILNLFLKTAFEGGRHQRRVDKLNC